MTSPPYPAIISYDCYLSSTIFDSMGSRQSFITSAFRQKKHACSVSKKSPYGQNIHSAL